MKHSWIITSGKHPATVFSIMVLLLFSAMNINAQPLPDFSGIWVQDAARSDDFYKDFNVKSSITQTPQNITIKTTFSDKTGKEMVTRENSFSLDGKVLTGDDGSKKSAKWSSDKKTLTTSDTKVYGGDNVGVTTSYTLSGDGKVMIVKTADINPAAKSITQYFNKQK